jgi:FMN phosphatase YigB (HAD superfamily)
MLQPDPELIEDLRACPLKLVGFTNAPRAYAVRVLETLDLRQFFPDEGLLAVDDVLPHCKPEAAAFALVLKAIGTYIISNLSRFAFSLSYNCFVFTL